MTTTTPHGQVPEALQPDTALLVARNCRETGSDPSCPFFARVQLMDAAYVLERLHAENATLQSGYDAARLEIEALHARVQAAPAPLSESIDQLERELAIIGVVGAIDGHDVVRRESVLEIARRATVAAQGGKV